MSTASHVDSIPIEGDALTSDQVEHFSERGYLVLPGLISDELVQRLMPEVDRWTDEGFRRASIDAAISGSTSAPPVVELDMAAHGELACLPGLMRVLEHLLGRDFVYHHMHSSRQEPATDEKPWHHDYEGAQSHTRDGIMVHVLCYLGGLTGDVSPLVVVPGSHRRIVGKQDLAPLGARPLKGEVVIDDLPPGSAVLAHSALLHARRKTEHETQPRYFIDTSYCQSGYLWRPVKPYWRDILRRAEAHGLGKGTYPQLFDDSPFIEFQPSMDGS